MHASSLLTSSLTAVAAKSQAPLRRGKPRVWRLSLDLAAAAAQEGANGVVFNVNFPGELGLEADRNYMMAVEYFHVVSFNNPDLWFRVHLDGLLCPNLADSRQPSNVIHCQYGEAYNATVGRDTLGIPVADRTFLRSKQMRLYFTDPTGARMDLTATGFSWVLGLIVWETE